MNKFLLYVFGALYAATAFYIFFFPQEFFVSTPGLDMMGPFSIHFIRDVALAFLASGAALIWGTHNRNRAVCICGALWPFLHGLFHVQIWSMRGFPFDYIFFYDAGAVIVPSFLAMAAAWTFART